MKSTRQAILAGASLLAAVAATPTLVRADDQQKWPGNNGDNRGKDDNSKRRGQEDRGGQDRGQRDQQDRGQRGQQDRMQQQGQQDRGQQRQQKQDRAFERREPGSNGPGKQFGGDQPNGNPNAFIKPQQMNPQKPPVVNNAPQQPQQQLPNAKPQNFDNQFGNPGRDIERRKREQQKQFGGRDQVPNQGQNPGGNSPGNRPVVDNPNGPQKQFGGRDPGRDRDNRPFDNPNGPQKPPQAADFGQPRQPLSAADARRRFETMRGSRKEVKIDGGKGVVIEEPGKRRIIKENNRMVIQHDETERLRRVAPNARFEKGQGGSNVSIIDRPGGYRVYSETDSNGQLLRRYRRGPDGRDVIIIDNRRRHGNGFGKGVATGVGIGIGVVAGAAILNSILDVPPPRVRIPRDKYIVDYGRASDDDVYEALSAPPVDDYDDRYTLDEIRATSYLRDRMRRIDLDDITFEFGSWDVDPSQYRKLERIARGMNRIIDRNPNEVFMIEGYTDAVGSEEDNLSLSDRRAESVAEVLTEQFQVPFENLVTQGYGEQYLKVPTQAPELLNRRVAVRRITPLLARDGGPPPPPGRYPD
ncbi:OmpA family protein [Hyphomicrobium facile]|uniref:Outer membrane protein OmpA n=1 Tax=Hyphomicrobium facile TaxID=51670 RepID=A0A1I7NQ16_9HYPH|nr:OmpA family protein [Hyphomicrobium facile]SFV36749.1 Outer membrane protein OmpA [Hyphomicrobium facile]